jgi:hypothetical protein
MKTSKRDERFLKMIQHRAARVAITASAARNQGAPGTVDRARRFVSRLDLRKFGTGDDVAFARQLDRATMRLLRYLPKRATWGTARKLLNIFLRDCFYTGYLCRAYDLGRAEPHFEVPLDSITSEQIRAEDPNIPPWPGVRRLKPEVSHVYQEAARSIGRRQGLRRVHLDAFWWGGR